MPASAVLATTDGLKLIRADKAEKNKAETWTVPARGLRRNRGQLLPRSPRSRSGRRRRASTSLRPSTRPDGKPSAEIATASLAADGNARGRGATSGPRTSTILESYGLGLERTVDFGWYGILARPLLWLMNKSYAWSPNWGVAILVVTFLIRLLLFPLTAKSYTSMKKMQKLAPKMNAIRDKYKKAKTDAAQRQKMNAELMALYQTEGYNPMSGCLPVLLQLPILVAFYNVLSRTIELRHAPFVLWIKDLSAIDHTYVLRDPDDRLDVSAAGHDALDARSRAEKDLHVHAAALGVLPQGHALGARAVLAVFQPADDRAAARDEPDREGGRPRAARPREPPRPSSRRAPEVGRSR